MPGQLISGQLISGQLISGLALPDLSTLYLPGGLAIGLGAAAPVGPVNLLVIQRTLAGQGGAALLLGLGAALGDMVFGIITAFGLGAIGLLLREHDAAIRSIGGLAMIAFAVMIWRATPHLAPEAPGNGSRLAALGFSMAITNPATMLFFVGSFSAIGFLGLGHDTGAHRANAALLVGGVLAGSMLWWLVVVAIAARFAGRVSNLHLRRLNQATAIALALFGAGAIIAATSTLT